MTDPLTVSYTYDPFATPRYAQAVSLAPGVIVVVHADTLTVLNTAVRAMQAGFGSMTYDPSVQTHERTT